MFKNDDNAQDLINKDAFPILCDSKLHVILLVRAYKLITFDEICAPANENDLHFVCCMLGWTAYGPNKYLLTILLYDVILFAHLMMN